jgi:tetratricopeptide (TPR) repeat protein
MTENRELLTGYITEGNYRYPGSRPFYDTKVDRCLFFGREQETQLLLHKTLNWDIVVLYAKSGLGKTSLINAGLNQELRDRGYMPINVRMNNTDIADPLPAFFQGIKDFFSAPQVNLDYEHGEEDSLWQFFRTSFFWGPGNAKLKPVVILDQFEEFFTSYSKEKRKRFIHNLADLVNNTVPGELLASFQTEKQLQQQYNLGQPGVKIIISIRENFLGQLEEISKNIPIILNHRFRLMPLTRQQAKQAIIEPSQLQHEAIQADSFKFTPEAVDMILDFLCKQRERDEIKISDEVEPFQLQILCRHLEEKSREKGKKIEGEITIGKEDLSGEKGMQQVLQQFYEDQLKKLGSFVKRKRVRSLLEKGLISFDDRRLSLEEREIIRRYRVSENLLTELVSLRLLRSEPRVGSLYYELNHDTMVEPIRKSKKKRKAKRWIKIGIVFLLVLIIGWIWIMHYWYPITEINKLYEEAGDFKSKGKYTEAIERYDRILRINKTYVNAYLEKGQIFYNKNNYDKAIKNYNDAIENKVKNDQIYYHFGEALKAKGEYEKAIKNYRKSLEISSNLSSAYEGLGDVYESLKDFDNAANNFKIALDLDKNKPDVFRKLSVAFLKKGKLEKAIDEYKRALKVNHEYAYIYEGIAEELRLRGDTGLIEKIYDLASTSGSKAASFYSNLGYDYHQLRKYDKAIENYKKAIDIDPMNAYNYNNMGVVFFEIGNYNDAKYAFDKAIALKPDYADAQYNVGVIFHKIGKDNSAMDAFEKATKIKDISNAYDLMGYILVKQKKYNEAIESYQKAIKGDPGNSFKLNLIEAYFVSGNFSKALILSNELLRNGNILNEEDKLFLQFISISSLMFQGRDQEAFTLIKKFINYYNSIRKNYKPTLKYDLIKQFVEKNNTLPPRKSKMLLIIIDILDPTKKSDKKVKDLEFLILHTFN